MYETDRASVNDYDLGAASVPAEELDTFDEKVIASLKKVVDDGIDMTRLAQIIERDRRKVRVSCFQALDLAQFLFTVACRARVERRRDLRRHADC